MTSKINLDKALRCGTPYMEMKEPNHVISAWVTSRRVHFKLDDDSEISFLASDWPNLAKASPAELAKVEIWGRDTLAWPHLNEHLSALAIFRQQNLVGK